MNQCADAIATKPSHARHGAVMSTPYRVSAFLASRRAVDETSPKVPPPGEILSHQVDPQGAELDRTSIANLRLGESDDPRFRPGVCRVPALSSAFVIPSPVTSLDALVTSHSALAL